MFDVWSGNTELTIIALIVSVAVILPVQLLLCFKIRKNIIRLLPVMVLSVLTAVFSILAATTSGWDSLGYIVLAVFTGIMLLACGGAWGIWAIAKRMKKGE